MSSLHVTFPTGAEWASLGTLGLMQRRGIQYFWENRPGGGYTDFEDFLSELKQSRRKSVRQERRSVERQGLAVRRLRGGDVSAALWDRFYEFYLATTERKWGSAYLTREFFHMLGDRMPEEVLLVVADEAGRGGSGGSSSTSATVAAALNLVGSDCIYGRNWGCEAGREFKHLHFELCYYSAIEEAIERRLPRVEAGAQGEHKLHRGYLPSFTYSAHLVRDPVLRSAVAKFLAREDQQVWRSSGRSGCMP